MFTPRRVFFEREALDYPLGRKLFERFRKEGQEIGFTTSHNRVTGVPGTSRLEKFVQAKKTLVVGVRRTLKFAGCKPSAHYQLPLTTGCPGHCQYCYLHTTLGTRPYLRLYVNIDDILEQAGRYIKSRFPEDTLFEGSATSDPLAVEQYSGALARTIIFFSLREKGFFRFATKQTNVEGLLKIKHEGKTTARFSINTPEITHRYEKGVPPAGERIKAALKMKKAGFPVGFLVAPVFIYEGWEKDYLGLLREIASQWKKVPAAVEDGAHSPTFEIIAHRFTARAKKNILSLFPHTTLPLEEKERKFRYGQFGYGKYIYSGDIYREMKNFFTPVINDLFPRGKVEYIV